MRLITKNRRKHLISNENIDQKSPHMRRRSAPIRTPPVDPFPEHRKLCAGQTGRAIFGARPWKPPPFQNFVIQAEPLAIPVKQLQPIPTPPTQSEHRTTRRFLAQHIPGQSGKTRDPLPHIRNTTCQINPNPSSRTDHAASTARINRVSATSSMELSNRRQRPPCKRSSSGTAGAGFGSGGASATGKSIGRKTVPTPNGHRPFFFNSCRHL
jgi:hypothetical protein